MLQSQRSFNRNGILASLSPEDFESLAPHLNPLTFKVRHVFFRPHEQLKRSFSQNRVSHPSARPPTRGVRSKLELSAEKA